MARDSVWASELPRSRIAASADQQEGRNPHDVDRVARRVLALGGEVDESAVPDSHAHDAGGEQQQAGTRTGVHEHHQRDREDDEVLDRIGHAEDDGAGGVAALAVDRAKGGGPADVEQRARDHQAVEDEPQPALSFEGGGRPYQQGRERERREQQVADVGEGGERRRLADDDLVVGPRDLAQPPAAGGRTEQRPGDPQPAGGAGRPPEAGGRAGERGQSLYDVVEGAQPVGGARVGLQQRREGNQHAEDRAHRSEASIEHRAAHPPSIGGVGPSEVTSAQPRLLQTGDRRPASVGSRP